MIVLGEVASRALARRQFYVGNTRYRGSHAIYVAKKDEILERLTRPDAGRELATEFTERNGYVVGERILPRSVRALSPLIRRGWLAAEDKRHRLSENHGQRMVA